VRLKYGSSIRGEILSVYNQLKLERIKIFDQDCTVQLDDGLPKDQTTEGRAQTNLGYLEGSVERLLPINATFLVPNISALSRDVILPSPRVP
jgi:hypothetical protein